MSTPFHARYFAHELTRPSRGDVGAALFNACVELNPHQIEAASFVLKNPLSPGVLLADEVGLGKTIQAGLVLCQHWAERKRRLLVICPASLRKQWSQELTEKFALPNVIVDSRNPQELDQRDRVVITSYNFAATRADQLREIRLDLVVIDEAHKLRNVFKPNAQTAQKIKEATSGRRKVLLTATPLQNSLMELYGIATMLSDELFGDAEAFRASYVQKQPDLEGLRARLGTFCHRTLRRNVTQYINFRERRALTFRFAPTDDEHRFYEAVSAYLMREDTFALGKKGRQLIEILALKLLASSPPAIARTLDRMRDRLVKLREGLVTAGLQFDEFEGDEDLDSEAEELASRPSAPSDSDSKPAEIDRAKLDAEISEVDRYSQWARSISVDTKSRKLLEGLQEGFRRMRSEGAREKALVFTESRRTQEYLRNFLEANGFAGKVVLFNGANSDPESRAIVDRWIQANRDTGRVSGSRTVDSRMALVEHFRDHATVMLATEAAAEGINLQFCSMVVNYDLPWNPQRIEQRIGRCHRYGQKHDVVVINFLNERNRADVRVHELLDTKFSLFNGLFGASDEVLGSIESGVDFERRVLEIHRSCRTPEEIDAAFNRLQEELRPEIERGIESARKTLLDQFDEDVHSRLKLTGENAQAELDKFSRMFWALTSFMLRDRARFDGTQLAFELDQPPLEGVARGRYQLISKSRENVISDYLYRLTHPLGEWAIEEGKRLATPTSLVRFDVSSYPRRLAMIEDLKGQTGWLTLQRVIVESADVEEFLLFSGVTDSGRSLDQEACEKLFLCSGKLIDEVSVPHSAQERLSDEAGRHLEATLSRHLEANNQLFRTECEIIEKWARDIEDAAELRRVEIRRQIDAVRKRIRLATTTDEHLTLQEEMTTLESRKRQLRREIEDIEDQTAERRTSQIERLKKRLTSRHTNATLFTLRWEVS